MNTLPTQQMLKKTLVAAARAHHEFQTNYLAGVRHEQWAWWYAAYLLGRLGDFTEPTLLTNWLFEVTEESDWFGKAAEHIISRIGSG